MRAQRRSDQFSEWLHMRLRDRLDNNALAPNVDVIAWSTRHPIWLHPWYAYRNRFRHGWRTIETHRVGGDVVCIMVRLLRRGGSFRG